MSLQDHIAAIDDAFDDFAEDSTVSLAAYAAAMEDIAERAKAAADAARVDLLYGSRRSAER